MELYAEWLGLRVAEARASGEFWMIDPIAIQRAWAAEQLKA